MDEMPVDGCGMQPRARLSAKMIRTPFSDALMSLGGLSVEPTARADKGPDVVFADGW